jgi:acyl-CoA synthetase (NDP forming)
LRRFIILAPSSELSCHAQGGDDRAVCQPIRQATLRPDVLLTLEYWGKGEEVVALDSDLTHVLGRGLAPRAVALYGASARRPNSQAFRIAKKLLTNGHAGRLVLVNPNSQEVHGVATVAKAGLSELAAELDLAIIAVPRESVVDALDDAADAGIGLAIVTTAQFAESDARGVELQEELVARARQRNVRLIGPNCMGVINYSDGLIAAGREIYAPPGHISVVAQSGFLSMRIMDYIAETGQGVDLWVTIGNSADLAPTDLIEYLGARAQTSVIVVYLENVPDPPRLAAAIAGARAAGTDVVLVKSGRTEVGSQLAASHTGALASPDVFVDVLAEDADCIRVETVREAAQVASLIAAFGERPTGPFLVTSGSGGDCVLAGDACAQREIPLARLSATTLERLHEIVPEAGNGNPLDISPFPFDGTGRQVAALAALAEAPEVGCVVLMDGWGWDSHEAPEGRVIVLDPLIRPGRGLPVPVIVDSRMEEWQRTALVAAGLAVTSDGETIWRSLGHIVRQARCAGALAEPDTPAGADGEEHPATTPERLPERTAFSRLRAAGVPMVATEVVTTPEELLETCCRLGYPVVLKGLVPGVVHKADQQLVHTVMSGDGEALDAWKRLAEVIDERGGEVVVQPMLTSSLAEVIVATRDDPAYGLHVMVGDGGKWIEFDSDVAWAKAPITASGAQRLIRRTNIGRGLAKKHPEVLAETALPAVIAAISDVAAEWIGSVTEIEINPLIVRRDRIEAVDAVVTLRPDAEPVSGH